VNALEAAISEFLFANYGLQGSLERLGGENLNYLVTTPKGRRQVLKIVEEPEAEESAELENRLLEHARKAGFELGLPVIEKTYRGEIDTRIDIPVSGSYRARMLRFVNGDLLENQADISMNLLSDVGFSLARLDRALAGFDHPALHRQHRWELKLAGRHRDKLHLVSDDEDRALVAWAFDRWSDVRDTLDALPAQAIHGDANPENILVEDGRVSGFVDFGDACHNPRACELAICLAYLMMDRDDPLQAADAVTEAYAAELHLSSEERAVLLPLVCGRLAVTVAMASARRAIDPDNPNWFLSLEPALALLRRLRREAP
jgi:Ser/Thr protein kinase RdoA (MazF antagonist)